MIADQQNRTSSSHEVKSPLEQAAASTMPQGQVSNSGQESSDLPQMGGDPYRNHTSGSTNDQVNNRVGDLNALRGQSEPVILLLN